MNDLIMAHYKVCDFCDDLKSKMVTPTGLSLKWDLKKKRMITSLGTFETLKSWKVGSMDV